MKTKALFYIWKYSHTLGLFVSLGFNLLFTMQGWYKKHHGNKKMVEEY